MNHREDLAIAYGYRYSDILEPLTVRLEKHIAQIVKDKPRIDRVVARSKTPSSFLEKASRTENGMPKYSDPLNQIQDQIGARIVTYYLSDIPAIAKLVHDYFAPVEELDIIPESPKEFDYEGKHFILFIPKDLLSPEVPRDPCPTFFELQIKTLFQHAWGQADHDLAYKPPEMLTRDQKRRVAFTAAQAWGADIIFNELALDLQHKDTS